MLPRSEWRRPFLRRSSVLASLCLSVALALALGAAWHVHRRSQSLSTVQVRLADLRKEHAALVARAAEEDRLASAFHRLEAAGVIQSQGEGEWLEGMRRALVSEPLILSPVVIGDEGSGEGSGEAEEGATDRRPDRQGVRVERIDAGMEHGFLHEEDLIAFFRRLRLSVGLPVSVTRCKVARPALSDSTPAPAGDSDRQGQPVAPDPLLEVACRLRWTKVVIPTPDLALRPPGVRQAAFEAGSFSLPTIVAEGIDPAADPILPPSVFDRLLTSPEERKRLDRIRLFAGLAAIRKVDPVAAEPVEESTASSDPPPDPPDPPEPEAAPVAEPPVEAEALPPLHFGGIIARSGVPRWIWVDGQRLEVDLLPSDSIAIPDPHPAIRVRIGDRWVELLPGQDVDPNTGEISAPLHPLAPD